MILHGATPISEFCELCALVSKITRSNRVEAGQCFHRAESGMGRAFRSIVWPSPCRNGFSGDLDDGIPTDTHSHKHDLRRTASRGCMGTRVGGLAHRYLCDQALRNPRTMSFGHHSSPKYLTHVIAAARSANFPRRSVARPHPAEANSFCATPCRPHRGSQSPSRTCRRSSKQPACTTAAAT